MTDPTQMPEPRPVMTSKPMRKASPAAPKRARITPALSPGDTIEYGLTAELKHPRKGSWWIKAGATTTIRDGETPASAKVRLTGFVHHFIEEGVEEVLTD